MVRRTSNSADSSASGGLTQRLWKRAISGWKLTKSRSEVSTEGQTTYEDSKGVFTMKKSLVLSFALSLIFSFAGMGDIAHGTLIGDTVVIEHHWPGFDNISHRTTKKVVAGACEWSYVVKEQNGHSINLYTVNIEAHTIRIDFPIGYQWANWEWNGLVVRHLTWMGNRDEWNIKTNLEDWDTFKHLYYGKNYVAFNFQDLGSPEFYPPDSYLELEMSAPSPVFKYSALLLVATGLVGFAGFSKKFRERMVKTKSARYQKRKRYNLNKGSIPGKRHPGKLP